MKKTLALALCLTVFLLTLAGCAPKTVSSGNAYASDGNYYASYGNYYASYGNYVSDGDYGYAFYGDYASDGDAYASYGNAG